MLKIRRTKLSSDRFAEKLNSTSALRHHKISIQTQITQTPANRNGRSKQPIIEAANQTLALLAVFVYAIDCVRCVWMETEL